MRADASISPFRFAFSGPFQLFSDQGLEVVRSIVAREQHRSREHSRFNIGIPSTADIMAFHHSQIRRAVSSARGSKRALRGCYYASPFVRFLMLLLAGDSDDGGQ